MSLRMPAEHGAWGMLAVPFLCAAVVAGIWNVPLALAGVAILSLFVLRGSLETEANWKALLWPAHLALAGLIGGAGSLLVFRYGRYELVALAVVAGAIYLFQRDLVARHNQNRSEKRSLLAELVGVVVLSLAAPAAWIAARGRLEAPGVVVWLMNLLFFLGGVLYVKYRVRGLLAHRAFDRWDERLGFAWPVFLYHILLAVFLASWIFLESRPAALLLAFTPGILRAHGLLFQLGRRFPIRQLGWSEVIHSVVFGILLVLAFHL